MKNLATKNISDFFVSSNGQRYISQRKAAELCGVTQSALSQFIKKKGSLMNQVVDLKGKNTVSSKSSNSLPKNWSKLAVHPDMLLVALEHYAYFSKAKNDAALKNVRLLSGFAIDLYIDQQCGYAVTAHNPDTNHTISYPELQGQLVGMRIELNEKQRELLAVKGRQPNHPASLACIMGCKVSEVGGTLPILRLWVW